MTTYLAWVGLGSSMGERLDTLRSACAALDAVRQTQILAASSVYATSPVGPASGEFFNAALRLRTELAPRALLTQLLAIERAHGRTRNLRWGDRSLDLDLLMMAPCHEDGLAPWLEIDEPGLALPHPRIWERDFVLVPLAQLDPGLQVRGQSLQAWTNTFAPIHATIRREQCAAEDFYPT